MCVTKDKTGRNLRKINWSSDKVKIIYELNEKKNCLYEERVYYGGKWKVKIGKSRGHSIDKLVQISTEID